MIAPGNIPRVFYNSSQYINRQNNPDNYPNNYYPKQGSVYQYPYNASYFPQNNSPQPYNKKPSLINNGKFYSPSKLNTDAAYFVWKNPNSNSDTSSLLTILHLNDNHRKVDGLTRFKTAFDQITNKLQGSGVDLLKVHSGDYNAANDFEKLKLQVLLLNNLGINYAAIGNHELDVGPKKLTEALNDSQFISLAANLKLDPNCELNKLINSGKIVNSSIFESNGNRYGLIGISPPDISQRCDPSVELKGVEVLNEQDTINNVQQEVNKLKSQGINKILLVSHVGKALDKKIAESTEGIDIILGGHSHDLLKPLAPSESLTYSISKEPVLILQDGRDAKNLGVTDLAFDSHGIVQSAVARQEKVDNFPVNASCNSLEDKVLGKSPTIGYISDNYTSNDVKKIENPIANFIADAVKIRTGAEIALVQSFSIRDDIKKGQITERMVDELLPFIDTVYTMKITGQDILDALTNGSQSYARKDKRPGILQVSGLKYTITNNGEVSNVMIKNKDESYTPLEPKKEYTIATDTYLIRGLEGFKSLAKPYCTIKGNYETYGDILKHYIRSFNNEPIKMQNEGRITVLAQKSTSDNKNVAKINLIA